MKNYNKNNKGFSLIELMISMTVMSALSVGIATMMQNQMNTSVYLDDKASYRDLKIELDRQLLANDFCTNNFASKTFPNVVGGTQSYALDLKDSSGNVIFPSSTYDNLTLSRYEIKNIDLAATATTGNGELHISINRSRGGAASLNKMVFPIKFTLDASRNIETCVSSNIAEEGQGCLRIVASYSNPLRNYSDGVRLDPVPPRRVPSNIDAVSVVMRGNSSHHESADDTHYNCTSIPSLATFKLDAIPLDRFKPNFNITWVRDTTRRANGNLVYYNGIHIGTERFCGDARTSTSTSSAALYRRSLDTCPLPTDPPERDVNFYRYHKNL